MTRPHIVKTICNMCVARCGIDVALENGRIVNVTGMQEHPFNMLCAKVRGLPELAHSPHRLDGPLKKTAQGFQKISWKDAFDEISEKLIGIREQYGARSLLVHLGVPFIYSQTEYMARRFCDLYGTPNYTTGASFCFLARVIGHCLTCGHHIAAHYPGIPECMVIWGQNPTESRLMQADHIHALMGRGSKLIVVDPRKTPLAKKADIHAQIRPGTDCALALGLLNVIIEENLYDKEFVRNWTVGFDLLAGHVRNYSPDRVETITWIPSDTIRAMARLIAGNRPTAISPGISLDHSTNGIQAIRAVATLVAVTGNLDIPGGNTYGPGFRMTNLRVTDAPVDGPPVGEMFPVFTRFTQEQSAVPAMDQILSESPYPIKAALIAGANPALTWPNTNKFNRCREKLDLMVVMDIFMTETARMADFVLPGTSFLETENIRTYPSDMSKGGLPLVAKSNRVIDPVGNAMEDWKIWSELGRKTGYGEYFPWEDNETLFEYLLKDTGVSLEELNENPGGIYYAEREFRKYVKDGFNTPSKKVEIFSQTLADHGYDPLPTFREWEDVPDGGGDDDNPYPFVFISGPRTGIYTHSQYRNLDALRKILPNPEVEINPQTAAEYGIEPGSVVRVESKQGFVELKARITDDVHPKILVMQHGWSMANANLLTTDENRDPISGYPGFRSVRCRLRRV